MCMMLRNTNRYNNFKFLNNVKIYEAIIQRKRRRIRIRFWSPNPEKPKRQLKLQRDERERGLIWQVKPCIHDWSDDCTFTYIDIQLHTNVMQDITNFYGFCSVNFAIETRKSGFQIWKKRRSKKWGWYREWWWGWWLESRWWRVGSAWWTIVAISESPGLFFILISSQKLFLFCLSIFIFIFPNLKCSACRIVAVTVSLSFRLLHLPVVGLMNCYFLTFWIEFVISFFSYLIGLDCCDSV